MERPIAAHEIALHLCGMESAIKVFVMNAALLLELLVVVLVLVGAALTLWSLLGTFGRLAPNGRPHREIWLRFARWILLALEFALGADIIRTAIAPTWDDVGKLAAIAAIRTGLGFFLERDIEEVRGPDDVAPVGQRSDLS